MSVNPRIVIHGGMHKTGTSSLQRVLGENRKILLKNGILYPDFGNRNHGFILNIRKHGWTPEPLLNQIQLARDLGASVIIFSGEVVSTLSEHEFRKLEDCFKELDILFVFSFRHWCDYLPSRWAQNCRRRDSQSFREYISNLQLYKDISIDARFDLVLSRAAAGSSARIQAISYSNAVTLGRSPLADVLSAMGVSNELISRLLRREPIIDVRQDWILTETLRLLNGALSTHLQLNQNDLFQRSRDNDVGNITFFDLGNMLNKFEKQILLSLREKIIQSEIVVCINCDDDLVKYSYETFSKSSRKYFTNLIEREIFFGKHTSKTKCTDLHWNEAINAKMEDLFRLIEI